MSTRKYQERICLHLNHTGADYRKLPATQQLSCKGLGFRFIHLGKSSKVQTPAYENMSKQKFHMNLQYALTEMTDLYIFT